MTQEKPEKHYRVVRLQAENIKRIEAVDITPEGDLVIVAGKNGHGKTSVLDSIMYALGGKDVIAAEPVRRGAAKAEVTIDCGEFVATRKFTQKGQQLILKSKSGQPIEQPQTFLDSIIGKLSFDPLAFAQMKPKDRLNALLSLTDGLDEKLAEIEQRRAKLFEDRKEWNITVRNLTGQLSEMQAPGQDWPEGEVNPQVYIDKRNGLQDVIRQNDEKRAKLQRAKDAEITLAQRVESLRRQLVEAEEQLSEQTAYVKQQTASITFLADPDLSKVDQELAQVIEANKLAVKRRQYEQAVTRRNTAAAKAEVFTNDIEQCDHEKAALLESANLPIPGLGFSDGDVLFNGMLFDQLSDAEKLKVSLAMAMAANPSMRVVRITNGSLLDEDSLAVVRNLAVENDYQVWIECVGNRDDATVIIENGKVAS